MLPLPRAFSLQRRWFKAPIVRQIIPDPFVKPAPPPEPKPLGVGTFSVPVAAIQIRDKALRSAVPAEAVQSAKKRDIAVTKYAFRPGIDKRVGLFAVKLGMMTYFDAWGKEHPCTVLQVCDNQAFETQRNNNGKVYTSVAAVKTSPYRMPHAQRIRFLKYGLFPRSHERHFEVSDTGVLPPGTPLYACHFIAGQTVMVQGRS